MALGEAKLIEVQDVRRTYVLGSRPFNALAGVSLTIASGDYVAIMGPSGSGKSTLMHILGLLDTPSSGRYLFRGQDVTTLSDVELARLRNREIGFVFQSFNLLPRLTAAANVEIPLLYARTTTSERKARVAEALAQVGLTARSANRPNELSGGEMQRVAIARALVNRPAVILADEPTGNLDSKTGSEIMRLFDSLAAQGNTIVLVTHDAQVAHHAARIIQLIDGHIAQIAQEGHIPAQSRNSSCP